MKPRMESAGRFVVLVGVALMMSSGYAIEIVCHRGANELAPENTRAAAQVCVDLRVEYVEVDVRTSKDGVMYILHDSTVDRTTNGKGALGKLTSDEIDGLDAGSWLDPKFAGEKLPRLEPFLRWIKGKAKVYFDVKAADVGKLVKLVRELGTEKDCFFWFGSSRMAKAFREAAPDLALKINAYTPAQVDEAKREFNAQIVECGLGDLTPEFREACRRNAIKIMILEGDKDPEAFRKTIESGVEMVNLNHPDLFIKIRDEMAKPAK